MPTPPRAVGQEVIPRSPARQVPLAAPPKRPLNPVATRRLRSAGTGYPPASAQNNIAATPRPTTPPPTAHAHTAPTPTKRRSRLLQTLQIPLIIIVGALLGVFVQSAIVGQIIILLYGAVALIWRIESRTTFTIAVMTIGITIILLFTQKSTMMAHNFASYSFMLLLIGIICMSREVREQKLLLVKKRGPERFKQYLKNRQKQQRPQRV